ncbi:hypothetical protein ES705_39066 [subsurface metagenome]
MKFWKWYLKGLLQIPGAIIAPQAEYVWGILLGVVAGMVFGINLALSQEPSPWILSAIPVAITIATHGYWRAWVRNK